MNKALRYAFRLLKYRLRSEYELRNRLKRRGYSEQEIKVVIAYLKEKNLVDDCEFARAWVESRIKKPLGIYRIRQELKVKGIDKDLIDQVINSIISKYSEAETIKGVIDRRWGRLKCLPIRKAKQRLILYLLQRGFSSDKIQEAIDLL